MARYLEDSENPDTQILYESKTHGNRYHSPAPSPVRRTSGYANTAESKGSQPLVNGLQMNSIIKRTHAALFGAADPSPTPPPAVSDFGEVEILEVATPQPFQSTMSPSPAGQPAPQSKHTCVFATCPRSTLAFGTAKDLRRHIINVHHLTEEDTFARIAARARMEADGSRSQAATPVENKAVAGGTGDSAWGGGSGRSPHKSGFVQDEGATRNSQYISERSASENGFATTSTHGRSQEPRSSIDLRCLLQNCPGHAGHYSSLKNLKRHYHDVHKLSLDEIAQRIADREKVVELGSEEEIVVSSSTPETIHKRKKVREAVHKCVYEECQRSSEGFGERYDLKRHLSTVHKMSTEDAAKTVAEQDARREELSKRSSDIAFGIDPKSGSGGFRINQEALKAGSKQNTNTPRGIMSAFRVSISSKTPHGDYSRENSVAKSKSLNNTIKHHDSPLLTDNGSIQLQQQLSDDQDDGDIYPETINLPETRTATCSKIQSLNIVRGIRLRPGKVLRGLAKGQANLESVLGQQRGEVKGGPDACHHCQLSRGPFEECVTVDGMLNQSCTNCHYNSEGSRCSFRSTQEDGGSHHLNDEVDELAPELTITADTGKDQPKRKRRSTEDSEVEVDEAALMYEGLDPYTPEYYTVQYANISEEERLQEESVLHMRLSCLAQARIQSLSKRRQDSEQYDESHHTVDNRPKGKRARRSH